MTPETMTTEELSIAQKTIAAEIKRRKDEENAKKEPDVQRVDRVTSAFIQNLWHMPTKIIPAFVDVTKRQIIADVIYYNGRKGRHILECPFGGKIARFGVSLYGDKNLKIADEEIRRHEEVDVVKYSWKNLDCRFIAVHRDEGGLSWEHFPCSITKLEYDINHLRTEHRKPGYAKELNHIVRKYKLLNEERGMNTYEGPDWFIFPEPA